MGVGMLAKGPVAVVIPMGALFIESLTRRDLGRFVRFAFDLPGWAVFAVIAGPWYAYALAVHGQAFIDGFILKHNVGRFSSTMLGHGGHYFYYVPALALVLLPYSGAVVRLLTMLREQWRDPLDRFLWCWFLLVFVLFSVSRTQLPHYILYGCAPLFLLLARHRDRVFLAGWSRRPGLRVAAFAMLVVALAGPVLFVALPEIASAAVPRANNAYVAALLAESPRVLDTGYRIVTASALLFCVVLAASSVPLAARLCGIALVQAALAVFLVVPALAELQQGPIKEAAHLARAKGASVAFWEMNMPSFSVYRGAVTPTRTREDPPRPGDFVLTRVDRREGLPATETVYERGGVLLLRVLETRG
jgi:4-amino-4-deoxy-L-arabinose transferase-like glycosyltransferase